MTKRITIQNVTVGRSSRSIAKIAGSSPATVRRIAEKRGPDYEYVVGDDDKVYRAHVPKRPPEFAYQRKAFARDKYAEAWSKRMIAEACGVSPMTIVRDLQDVQLDNVARVKGTDGKSYPARQQRRAPVIVVDLDGTATVEA